MMQQGPSVTGLMHRVAEIKNIFLDEPEMKILYSKKIKNKIRIDTKAVVSDMIFNTGGRFITEQEAEYFILDQSNVNRNYLGIVLIVCYLLNDNWFVKNTLIPEKIISLLICKNLKELSRIVSFELFFEDQERREELIRIALKHLELIPFGETEVKAKDRLNTLDSVERKRIIKKTMNAQKRAQELRAAMARKAAREAASKVSRE